MGAIVMKINPGWRPFGKDMKLPENSTTSRIRQENFSDMLNQQNEQASREHLQRKMEKIQQQGERLAKSMTVRELRQYKLLVKQFLDETLRHGIALKETRGWDRRGRSKRYKIVEEIDGSLLAMADELLENEHGRIDLLQRIGEIRGMLINLLF